MFRARAFKWFSLNLLAERNVYANDLKPWQGVGTPDDMYLLQSSVDNLHAWLYWQCLPIHHDKSLVMQIGRLPDYCTYRIGIDICLDPVMQKTIETHLGLMIFGNINSNNDTNKRRKLPCVQ